MYTAPKVTTRVIGSRGGAAILMGAVSVATLSLLALREWDISGPFPARFWNALAAFVIIGILSESFSFTIPVGNVRTSVAFVPIIASVMLFGHPWPMFIGGVTAFVGDTFVRNKPPTQVWFNAAQFMLASGLGGLVYSRLGGSVSLDAFDFALIPFACLVLVYFLVNHGGVALTDLWGTGPSVRDARGRIGKDQLAADLLSSMLAVLLAFLFVKLQLLGLAILVFALFLVARRDVRHS
jgi:MASE9 protein